MSNAVEKKRVLASGARIKDERLFGQLALSRSFGDCPFSSFLSVEPFIYTLKRNGAHHRFVILASDGVWDFVAVSIHCDLVIDPRSNRYRESRVEREDILYLTLFVSFTLHLLKRVTAKGLRKLLDRASMLISYEAYVRGSNDNICTMVISLLGE